MGYHKVSEFITSEIQAVLSEITALRDRAMALDLSIETILIPKAKEMVNRGDRNSVQLSINLMPACNTRMKLAAIVAQ